MVMILSSSDLISFQRGVQSGRLTRTGRPGNQHHPVRLFNVSPETASGPFSAKPTDIERELLELFHSSTPCRARGAQHFSPCTVGMIETRKSIRRPLYRTRKRPSCGTRRSAMSSSLMTLIRERIVWWCSRAIGAIACCSTPSMRYFTSSESSKVSRCISDARRSSAVKMVRIHEPDDRRDVVFAGQALDRDVRIRVSRRWSERRTPAPRWLRPRTRCDCSVLLQQVGDLRQSRNPSHQPLPQQNLRSHPGTISFDGSETAIASRPSCCSSGTKL